MACRRSKSKSKGREAWTASAPKPGWERDCVPIRIGACKHPSIIARASLCLNAEGGLNPSHKNLLPVTLFLAFSSEMSFLKGPRFSAKAQPVRCWPTNTVSPERSAVAMPTRAVAPVPLWAEPWLKDVPGNFSIPETAG